MHCVRSFWSYGLIKSIKVQAQKGNVRSKNKNKQTSQTSFSFLIDQVLGMPLKLLWKNQSLTLLRNLNGMVSWSFRLASSRKSLLASSLVFKSNIAVRNSASFAQGYSFCSLPECSYVRILNPKGKHFGQVRQFCTSEDNKRGIPLRDNKKTCMHEGCRVRALYGSSSDNRPRFCATHKGEGDVDLLSKRCEKFGCKTLASFGSHAEGVRRACSLHRRVGDVYLASKSNFCEHEDCHVQASYGSKDERHRRFCKEHKRLDDVDLVSKKCESINCEVEAR